MDPPTKSTATEEPARLAEAEIDNTRDPLPTSCFDADLQEKHGEKLQAEVKDWGSTTKRVAAKSKPLVADALAVTSKASSSLEGQSHGYNTASKDKTPEGAAMIAATAEAEVTAARTAADFEEAVSLIPGAIDESNKTLEHALVVLERLREDQVGIDDIELSAAAENCTRAGAALQQVVLEAGSHEESCEEAIEKADAVGAETDAAKDIAAKATAEMTVQLEKF